VRKTAAGIPLRPLLNLHIVCAQHEHVHTLLKALKKCLKYKFLVLKGEVMHEIFPEGVSPLCVPRHRESISKSQAGLPRGKQ